MSFRTNWTTPDDVDIAILDNHRNLYGEEEDGEEHVAIVLMQDQDGMVIEGVDIGHLREFVARLAEALDVYESDHPE